MTEQDTVPNAEVQQERYRLVSELISDYAYAFRVLPDGTLEREWVTGAFRRITGYTGEEIDEQGGVEALMHPDDQHIIKERLGVLLAGETDVREFRIVTREGDTRWLRDYARPIWEEPEQRVTHIYGAAQDITAYHQAEQALRDSREQYALAVQGSNDGIWDWDLTTNSLYLSPKWKEMLGYHDDELPNIFETFAERLHPDDQARVNAYVDAYLAGKIQRYEIEFRMRHKDGSWRWILARGEALRNDDGKPTRMAGSHTDVTERHQMESALRESEARFRKVIERNADALIVVDQEGIVKFANPAAEILFGLSLDDLENVPFGSPVVNEQKVELTLYAQGGPVIVEMYSVEIEWDGEPAYLASLRDVTERRRIEDDLRLSEEKYRTLTENLPVVLYSVQREPPYVVNYVSPRIVELTGYPAQAFLEDPLLWLEIVHPEDRTPTQEEIALLINNGHPLDVEYRIRTHAGKMRWVRDKANFVSTARNSAAPLIEGFLEDVTARKHAEAAMRESEARYQQLFESMVEGFVLHEVLYDEEGHPYDYRFLEANPAFETLTGIQRDEIMGRTIREMLPNAGGEAWLHVYQDVVENGQPLRAENYSTVVGRNFEFIAYSPRPDRCATIFSDISERKQAEERLAWESAVNAAIAELSRALVSSADLEDISWLVLEKAKELTESQFGYVGHIDPESGALMSTSMTRDIWEDCDVADKTIVFHTFTGLWGWVLENHRPLLSNNPATDPRSSGVPGGHIPVHRFLSAPAMLGEELVGQVALVNPGRDYTARDLALVERLASLYALAIQSWRAQEELRRYAHRQTVLYAISAGVASLQTPEALLSEVLEHVIAVLHANAGWVTVPAPDPHNKPQVVAHQGIRPSVLTTESLRTIADCPIYRTLLSPAEALSFIPPVKEESVRAAPPLSPAHRAEREDAGKIIYACPHLPAYALADGATGQEQHICIPLTTGGQLLGVLSLVWSEAQALADFGPTLFQAVGQQVGVALRNAQLYQEARQLDRLRVLNELDTSLAATLVEEEVSEVALRKLVLALDTRGGSLVLCAGEEETCTLHILDQNGNWTTPDFAPGEWEQLHRLAEHLRARRVMTPFLLRRMPVIFQDIDLPLPARWSPEDLLAPIWDEEGLVGLLTLGARRRGENRAFSTDDRALVQTAASRVGQALRSARLYAASQRQSVENAKLYENLKALLQERERAQMQMIQTEKMAALGRLVASLAHEINNPLQAVQGCLTLAREELDEDIEIAAEDAEALGYYIDIAEEEIERISIIVKRMRDFYRPAREGLQTLNIHEVLESVLALTRKQLEHSDIAVERAWETPWPSIQGNSDHLRQVFLNLVLNAIDAMPEGGTLTVRTRYDDLVLEKGTPPRAAARIDFTDSGVGMPPEVVSHIFEPFFTTKSQGSGLGLSISYGIVKAHHGRVSVTSKVGLGSTFSILLPLVQPDQPKIEEGE